MKLTLLLCLGLLCGCLSMEPRYHQTYRVPSFVVHVVDGGTMKSEYRKRAAQLGDDQPSAATPWGWRDPITGDVWVYCVSRRTGRPDMRALGEEVWHAPQAGGNFHPRHRLLIEIDKAAQ